MAKLLAAIVILAFSLANSSAFSQTVNCAGYEKLWPGSELSRSAEDKYFTLFKWVDGIPHWDEGGSVGLQANSFFISKIGLIYLARYCRDTTDTTSLKNAIRLRDWLDAHLVKPTLPSSKTNILRLEFSTPNLPYSPEPGWGCSICQSVALQLLLRIKTSTESSKRVKEAVRAFLQPASNGGLYTRYSPTTIMWEEVASTTPSRIINGHIFTVWQIERVIEMLPKSRERTRLAALNRQGKKMVVVLAKKAFLPPDRVLYDLRRDRKDGKPNTRVKGQYPVSIMIKGYTWLIQEGYPLQRYLDQLLTMEQGAPGE